MAVGRSAGHADPQAGERPRPATHHDRSQIGHGQPGIVQRAKHIGSQPFGVRASVESDPLGQHGAPVGSH